LPSAYGIVNNHGGIILLESKKGQGTKITVYWPALPKASPGISDGTAGVQHTVLVVDDDIVIRKLLEKILTKLNYKVLTAKDGREAQQIIQADPERIDVAIVDVILPDLSGNQVVEAVRDLAPHTKFILISGFPESRVVKDSMRDTRQAFLQKPIQPNILSQTIRQLLDT
jgi:DNA-binding NtrC family response regulator